MVGATMRQGLGLCSSRGCWGEGAAGAPPAHEYRGWHRCYQQLRCEGGARVGQATMKLSYHAASRQLHGKDSGKACTHRRQGMGEAVPFRFVQR